MPGKKKSDKKTPPLPPKNLGDLHTLYGGKKEGGDKKKGGDNKDQKKDGGTKKKEAAKKRTVQKGGCGCSEMMVQLP